MYRAFTAIFSKMVLTMAVNMNVLTQAKAHRGTNEIRLGTHQGVHGCKPGGSKAPLPVFGCIKIDNFSDTTTI
jgi:hypothetical protein